MHNQMQQPIEVLRQGLYGQRPVDEDVAASAALLAERLGRLKAINPLFETVAFSPDIEAMMASSLAMAVN
jgi:hypothetical protein